jgi:hypothetical protein
MRTHLMSEISLRLARPDDERELKLLADLDDRHLPPGPHLLASRDGEPCAALSLSTGEIVADPFLRTLEIGRLLRFAAAETGR